LPPRAIHVNNYRNEGARGSVEVTEFMAELAEKGEGECAFAVKVRVLLAGNAR